VPFHARPRPTERRQRGSRLACRTPSAIPVVAVPGPGVGRPPAIPRTAGSNPGLASVRA
jgi:hypothetical protein